MKDQITLFPRFHDSVRYGEFTIRRYHPDLTFKHTSIDGQWQFQINNRGFRDADDYDYEKPAGVTRVLALGDSHTSGYEVRQEQTFAELIEDLLRAKGVDAQSLNAGVSGFSTAEELVFLENEGIKYDPDFVVVGFYANDFEDNIKSSLFRLEDGQLIIDDPEHTPGIRTHRLIASNFALRWLSQYSYFYSFAFNMAYELAKSALLSKEVARTQTEIAIPTKEELGDYEQDLAVALLERMYRFCRERDVTLIVVDLPRVTGPNDPIQSSVPSEVQSQMDRLADVFLPSSDVFSEFSSDPTAMHVAHGHRHISEPGHAAVARAVAAVIGQRLELSEYQ